jgi:hypothetical protein
VVVVAQFARGAHETVLRLQSPAERLSGAGEAVRRSFDSAARAASSVPFVGDDLARALGAGTGAGDDLTASGRELATVVATAATGAATAVAAVGILPVVAGWLLLRGRWVRLAESARVARAANPDLLALRALTRQPAHLLLGITPDPAGAWRRADPPAVAGLASLELTSLGLRTPEHGQRPR